MQTKEKKLLPAICNLIGILMILLVIVTCVPLTVPGLMGYEAYNVESGSMEPEYPMGSVVYVYPTNAAYVNTGDVITFYRGEGIITHRVVENHVVEGEFITRGDANALDDMGTVPYSDYIGKVEYHLPMIGYLLRLLTTTLGKVYILIFAACGVMLNILASRIRKVRRNRILAQAPVVEESEDITTEEYQEAVRLSRRGSRARKALMVVFLMIFVLAAGGVAYIMWQYRLSDDLYSTAVNEFVQVAAAPSDVPPERNYNTGEEASQQQRAQSAEGEVEYYYIEGNTAADSGDTAVDTLQIPVNYQLAQNEDGETVVVSPQGEQIAIEDAETSDAIPHRRTIFQVPDGYQIVEDENGGQNIMTPYGELISISIDNEDSLAGVGYTSEDITGSDWQEDDYAGYNNPDDPYGSDNQEDIYNQDGWEEGYNEGETPDDSAAYAVETPYTTVYIDNAQAFQNIHVPDDYQVILTDDGGMAVLTPYWEQIPISVVQEVPQTKTVKKFRREFAPIRVDFDDLLDVNDDIIGWIYCKDSVINYPVLHGETNDTYLRHSYDGSYNVAGSIFIDAMNDPKFQEDVNTIIYGHHMQNGSMFASLDHWADQDYYEDHSVMWLLTPERDYKIVLFAGYHTSAYSDTYLVFQEYDEAFADYLQAAVEASDFQADVELDEDAHYVVMSTCAYIFENARYVLHGMLVPLDSAGGKPIAGSRVTQ